ncbi:hypothetical protein [Bradyrhizobium sp. sBnM-33]|uniref:hypothetical protein n=1 Tax=Bradyrhizobium sp. sBnM-33 TaxID=2831780 RepID=UPI001BCEDDD4|nr:hypothetical protein [Bradyrhizobium sp. sBnM-33]WOH51228.1 hypothetical protein RX328_02690 [Bradyrhizobium sp. sBnM-33]
MEANYKSPIEEVVDRLFSKIKAKRGESCRNPVTDASFVWGLDPIVVQKKKAVAALRAREWFAVNGPRDAPLLPLSHEDVEDYRNARGLAGVVGFFARSLSRLDYAVQKHPSFNDFARGLMAMNTGLWGIEKDENLKRRFPPCLLAGMTPGAYWAPPKEYEETMASYRRASDAA